MKKSFIYIFAVIAISLVLFNCSKNPTDPAGFGNKNTCYIVTFSQNGSSIQSANIDTKIKDIFVKHNIDLTSLKYTYKNVLNGFAAYLTGEQVASLKSDKSIKRIEADQIFSLVDGIDAGKPGKNPPPPPGDNWGVDYVGGPLQIGSGVAWIIDTGIDLDHPDLNVNTNFSKSFVNGRPTADDDNGHGSHCAGIIACKNTNYNIGICPGTEVIAVKVLNSNGNGTTSNIIAGIDYVAGNLVKDLDGNLLNNVVNMSFGGSVSQSLDDAVVALESAGAFVCIAAGNDSKSASNYSPARVGATEGDHIYTISAHDNLGVFANFSNYGNPPIEFAAPGVSICSCFKNGGYAWLSGTSMAAPHCCGILLGSNGIISTYANVTGDPDGTDDPIAHLEKTGQD